ncbi:MAG: NifB/NifX family molybdenum-iron cluster-binding protein [Actinomycetota bacterium]
MKIAVSSSGPDLESAVDPRFGRCAYLLFVDTDSLEFEAVPNPNLSSGGGAGIGTAQMVVDRGAKAVLTGNVGPNAFGVLSQAGIAVYTGVTGTVRQAVENLKAGGMSSTSYPTVGGHFGMRLAAGDPGQTQPGPAPFFPGVGMGPAGGMPGPGPFYPGGGMGPGRGRGGCRGRVRRGGGGGWRW